MTYPTLVGLAQHAGTTRGVARAWQRAGFLPPRGPYTRVDEMVLRAGAALHPTQHAPLATARTTLLVRLIRGILTDPTPPTWDTGLAVTATTVVALDHITYLAASTPGGPGTPVMWLPLGHWWHTSAIPTPDPFA